MSPEVKICGLRKPETVDAALRGGARYVGFIFFDKSPRNLTPWAAGELRKRASGRAETVAVTVNADDRVLDDIVEHVQPDLLQLHGSEPLHRVVELKTRFGLPVVKAFALREQDDLTPARPYRGVADMFLFDAKPPSGSELPGGNGVAFDWRLLQTLDRGMKYMLSGGLNAMNVGDAIRQIQPPAIDVSSGVESTPGVKETALIDAFFEAVRKAEQRLPAPGEKNH